MDIGSRMQQIRKTQDLTLQELVNHLNSKYNVSSFSRGRLSMWENNKDNPSIVSLKMIADYFNVSVDYFLNNKQSSLVRENNKLKNENERLRKKLDIISIIMDRFKV